MTIDCSVTLYAFGSAHDVAAIVKMFDSIRGNSLHGESAVGEVDAGNPTKDVGAESDSPQEELVWIDFSPRMLPTAEAIELSRRFPEAKLYLNISYEAPWDYERYWFKDGKQLLHDPDIANAPDEPDPFGVSVAHEHRFWREGHDDQHGEDHDAGLAVAETQIDQYVPEARMLINLTPEEGAYGCIVPVNWFIEFLKLNEGQSIRKESFAWFYGAPHDSEECIYTASVKEGVLEVQVEVGPEALVRRARFPLAFFQGRESQAGQQGGAK
ncbi:hypothetical protein [Novipirellula artificiosorum]|uniref:Uncharacterized protein n=1 Tax=Novipirellula artificiosorum TaxID=2528016 RepID=A0A5C6CII1_9BACT|nr:hypothetical protein [Novipirellula artificiosorum]TWU22559.1 hypothetical protein Poly41_71240 [Novipirellula artificiosorum]